MSDLDQNSFFERYGISTEDLESAKIEWSELEAIFEAHSAHLEILEPTASGIVDRLRQVKEVHSTKFRIKDPEHLLAKIIRKRQKDPERDINLKSYQVEITDLIGIRALHLFKTDWEPIHDFIVDTWKLHETPRANIREGDPDELKKRFEKKGCEVKTHPSGYRSVHYVIKSQPTKKLALAEVQVRTLFEEGWSEMDHRFRYPHALDDPILFQYLVLFNRLAGSADEMGSFLQILVRYLTTLKAEHDAELAKKEATIRDLQQRIKNLEISEDEKGELERAIKTLAPKTTLRSRVPVLEELESNIQSIYSPLIDHALIIDRLRKDGAYGRLNEDARAISEQMSSLGLMDIATMLATRDLELEEESDSHATEEPDEDE